MSNSLKVTSSARVFLTPTVPHRVGLLRRVEKDPNLHSSKKSLPYWSSSCGQWTCTRFHHSLSQDMLLGHHTALDALQTVSDNFLCMRILLFNMVVPLLAQVQRLSYLFPTWHSSSLSGLLSASAALLVSGDISYQAHPLVAEYGSTADCRMMPSRYRVFAF